MELGKPRNLCSNARSESALSSRFLAYKNARSAPDATPPMIALAVCGEVPLRDFRHSLPGP